MTPDERADAIIDQHGEIGLRAAIATALREAEARGMELAAVICSEFNNFAYVSGLPGRWEPGSPYDRGAKDAADKLAAAIRAEKERQE